MRESGLRPAIFPCQRINGAWQRDVLLQLDANRVSANGSLSPEAPILPRGAEATADLIGDFGDGRDPSLHLANKSPCSRFSRVPSIWLRSGCQMLMVGADMATMYPCDRLRSAIYWREANLGPETSVTLEALLAIMCLRNILDTPWAPSSPPCQSENRPV